MNKQRRDELGGKIANIINRLISEELEEEVKLFNAMYECLKEDPNFFNGYGFPINLSSTADKIKKNMNIPDKPKSTSKEIVHNQKSKPNLNIIKEKPKSTPVNTHVDGSPISKNEEKFNDFCSKKFDEGAWLKRLGITLRVCEHPTEKSNREDWNTWLKEIKIIPPEAKTSQTAIQVGNHSNKRTDKVHKKQFEDDLNYLT